jgi:hypothetical protein
MPDPEVLLRAAGVVKVVEQTWRLDPQGPTGNSSARIGERPRIEPGAVQQAREGEAWFIARGRFEHLMVARTTISDGYWARAHALVALARSWRPAEVLPGARTWVEAQAGGREALSGSAGSWPSNPHPGGGATGRPPERRSHGPGHRLPPALPGTDRQPPPTRGPWPSYSNTGRWWPPTGSPTTPPATAPPLCAPSSPGHRLCRRRHLAGQPELGAAAQEPHVRAPLLPHLSGTAAARVRRPAEVGSRSAPSPLTPGCRPVLAATSQSATPQASAAGCQPAQDSVSGRSGGAARCGRTGLDSRRLTTSTRPPP